MLDRTQSDPTLNHEDASELLDRDRVAEINPGEKGWRRPLGWLRRAGQFFFALSFSSLTRRIVSLNLAGLVALVASILYLSQFRAGLIDARAQSLLVQAEIIAGAIAASATVETNTITIDPDRLLDLKPGESYGAPDESSGLDFPINPERVAPVLRRLISPTKTRARIYGGDGGGSSKRSTVSRSRLSSSRLPFGSKIRARVLVGEIRVRSTGATRSGLIGKSSGE